MPRGTPKKEDTKIAPWLEFLDLKKFLCGDIGYKIAPWLKFLDLKKFLFLLTDDTSYLHLDKLHSRSTGGGGQGSLHHCK